MFNTTKYLYLITFAEFNKLSYFLFLNVLILIIVFSTILFIISAVKLNHNYKQIPKFVISILTFAIPMISTTFFGQIFYTLLTIFDCNYETNSSFYSESEECLQGIWFNIESIFVIIAMICLFCIAYVTNSVFYIPMCLKGRNKKIHSINDVIFLFTKIIINILFSFFKNNSDAYILLILCNLVTFFHYYFLSIYQGYSNQNFSFVNIYLSLVLFWGYFCLLLGKLIKELISFNGTSYLYLTGIILLFFETYYKTKMKNELYGIELDKITSYIEYYKYIIRFQTLIEKKNDSRENKITLKSIIVRIEENCTQPFCFLKRYLKSLDEGEDLDILLYYYMQRVFEEGINRFNHNITITISYIYFLLNRLSKKKKAILLFNSINKNIYSLDDLFNIYRCGQIVESLWTGFDGKYKEKIESVDIIKLFDYKNNVKEFKVLLNRIALLYYDFWLALFANNCEGKDQFKQLNDIGTKINKLLYQIENNFGLIHNIKNDDAEILNLYIFYLKDILNDEERYIKYHHILASISTDFNFKINEIDYSSYDINYLLKERKDAEYLIVSAEEKSKKERKILNMSLGLSSIIGYQPHEIIGKDINILIPRLFHKFHNSMLKKLTSKRKLELYKMLSKNLKYYPESISKKVYCKTKSKFLKQLEFSAQLIQTEDAKHIYIILIDRQPSFSTSWNIKGEAPPCCVLTDKNFIVQTFTADCCDLLGFNSTVINSNFEITSCILQFNEDIKNYQENSGFKAGGNSTYLYDFSDVLSSSIHGHGNDHKRTNNKKSLKNIGTGISISRNNSNNKINTFIRPFHQVSDKINLIKNKLKRQLIKTKYNSTQLITWKIKDENNESRILDNNYIDNKFELSVKECKISNAVVGYYFFFKKAKIIKKRDSTEEINYFKNYISYTIEDDDSGDNKSKETKKDMSSGVSNHSKVMNKSNTEYTNNKSGFYLSQQILNKGKRTENSKSGNEELKNNSNSKRISGISEEESKNFSFYLISGYKEDNQQEDNKIEKEMSLCNQILQKEREQKEKESIKFQKIEGNFVPKNCISFDFDFETMCFLPNMKSIPMKKKKTENTLVTDLLKCYQKKLSDLEKIQKKKEKESDNNKSEYSSNISETSENGNSSSSFYEETEKDEEKNSKENQTKIQGLKDAVILNKTLKEGKETINKVGSQNSQQTIYNHYKSSLKKGANSQNNNENDYYKIKFNKIRYFQYDFFKGMVVEDKQYEKISKMEKAIAESKKGTFNLDKLHTYFMNNRDVEYGNPLHKVESKIKTHTRHDSKKKESKIIFDEEKKSNLTDNEDEFKRKIKESLNKEDKQKSIEIFLIISVIIFVLLIVLGFLYNYNIIKEIKEDKENVILICYSAMLRTNFNSVAYFLREFTLMNFVMPNTRNNVNYTEYPVYQNNKSRFLSFMKTKIKNIYIHSNDLLYLLSSFNTKISEETQNYLNNDKINLEVFTEKYDLYNISTSFTISMIGLNAALYNMAIHNSSIQENNTEVFFFINNYHNKLGLRVIKQVSLFIDELMNNTKRKKNIFIITMCIYFLMIIIFFIILFITYKIIIKKKSSYIEGFYEIKLPFIRESLKNCEHFIYLLKKQKREEETGVEYEKSEESLQNEEEIENHFEEEDQLIHNFNKNIKDNYKNNQKNLSNQNKNRDVLSIIIFSLSISFYFLILIAFLILSYMCYYNFTIDVSNYSTFIFHIQRLNNNGIEFFNAYREYLFDENNYIDGMKCEQYMAKKLEETFSTKGNDSYIISTMYSKIKNLKKKYENFTGQSLCSRMEGDYFDNITQCEKFLDGQISYGYGITSFSLIDLTEIGYNFVKYYYIEEKNITGNLSDFGKYEYIVHDNQTFRLEMFNNDTIHTNLNVIFLHALLPYYIGIVNLTSNAIQEAVEDVDNVYIIIMICYIIFNVIIFLTIWIPFIKNMNSIIYNAKKILGIIPIHILSTLSNIRKILEIKNVN